MSQKNIGRPCNNLTKIQKFGYQENKKCKSNPERHPEKLQFKLSNENMRVVNRSLFSKQKYLMLTYFLIY